MGSPLVSELGESYEEGREFKDLQSFVKKKSKKPCNPDTLENCDKKDKKYLEEIKDFDQGKLKELQDAMDAEIEKLTAAHTEMQELFESQKETAMATSKKAEDLKKKLSKLNNKL